MKVMGPLKYRLLGEEFTVFVEIGHYDNGRLAIQLLNPVEDDPDFMEPFTTATVNMELEDCPEGEVWIKNWSENEGMVEWLIENGVIESGPTCNAQTGFVQVERFKLTRDFIQRVADALVASGERSRR